MPEDEVDRGGMFAGELDRVARELLGPESARWLARPDVLGSVAARVKRGLPVEDAILAEIHAVSAAQPALASEFVASFLPDLERLGHRVRSAQLQRFVDTRDLVQSVLGDLWPEVCQAEFRTRPAFVAYLARRLAWKAGDKARELNAARRREDLRVSVDDDPIDVAHSGPDPADRALAHDEAGALLGIVARLPERDREIVLAFLQGKSLDQIAEQAGQTKDSVRVALQRALSRVRRTVSEKEKP